MDYESLHNCAVRLAEQQVQRSCATVLFITLLVLPVAADQVELEVLTLPGTGPTAAHEWMSLLEKLDVDLLRFRQGGRTAIPSIDSASESGQTVYRITAVLANSRLTVPGARFSKSQISAFNDWLQDMPAHAAGDKATHAFGMAAEQLLYVHKALKQPLLIETKGVPLPQVVDTISRTLPIGLQSKTRLSDEKLTESLAGISSGTALAAALRPFGLVLVPVRTGRHTTDVMLEIRSVRNAEETWPIGWPSEQRINKLAPKMMDFLEVEIDDVPLEEALTALQGRLELPFLFDQNGMARHGIDPATDKVSFPLRSTFYKKILNNLLYQAKLKSELRVDEAGNPLLWIAPVKR